MRTGSAELRNRLAERYVLGVQTAAVRKRLRALAAADFALQRAIARCEQQFVRLAWSVDTATPSELSWTRIARALDLRPVRTGELNNNRYGYLAAASLAVAAITSAGWWQSTTEPPQVITNTVVQRVPETVTVALVSNEQGAALWLTSLRTQAREISVRVITPPVPRNDRDYQLWLLSSDGTPLSLGLLPQTGSRELRFDDYALAALADSELLAVSLEPVGGSPQAGPSGPVLYTAALLTP